MSMSTGSANRKIAPVSAKRLACQSPMKLTSTGPAIWNSVKLVA